MSTNQIVHEVAKAAPPVTVTGITIFGYQLPEVVMLVTLVYTTAQLCLLIWDRINKDKDKDDGCKR